MTKITFEISDNLVSRLEPLKNQIEDILELGLREYDLSKAPIYKEVTEFLASGPSVAEILALEPSEEAEERVRELLEKNREGTLSAVEEAELAEFQTMNHVITWVRATARQKTKAGST